MDITLTPTVSRDAEHTEATEVHDEGNLLKIGGLCGVLAVLLYLSSQLFGDVFHEFPIRASRAEIVAVWWLGTLWGPLAIVMMYAFYRLLARERDGAVNRIAFVYGVIGFTLVVLVVMVQLAVLMKASDLALDGPASQTETWHDMALVARGVDWGIDIAWDLFLGLWMLLTGLLMIRHSRLGWRWGVPAVLLAVVLLGFNAVAVPFPPDTRGLFDPGPFVGLYSLVLSAYLIRLGFEKRSEPSSVAHRHALTSDGSLTLAEKASERLRVGDVGSPEIGLAVEDATRRGAGHGKHGSRLVDGPRRADGRNLDRVALGDRGQPVPPGASGGTSGTATGEGAGDAESHVT